MREYICLATIATGLLLASCNTGKIADNSLMLIPMEAAIDAPAGLKASDCFREVTYVPLETNDSCLIGKVPYVQIIKDRIIVSTAQEQCLMFDKKTGRFICQVGHVGNDPEGYSSVHCWGDNETGMIYFTGWNNELVCYDQNGLFKEKIKVPFQMDSSPLSYNSLSDGTFVGYKEGVFNARDNGLFIFKDDEPLASHSMGSGEQPFDPSDIASISVMKSEAGPELFGPSAYKGVIIVDFKEPETGNIFIFGNTRLWRTDRELYFKEAYNDTIFQVKDTTLVPSAVLGLGKYHWDFSERFMKNKDNAVVVTQILDGKDRMMIRCIRKLFTKPTLYNVVVTKSTGEVEAAPYADGIEDDLTHFLPLQPLTVSPAGEFTGLLPAADVVEWFEENPQTNALPQQVKALNKLGEEDNPVVVVMK